MYGMEKIVEVLVQVVNSIFIKGNVPSSKNSKVKGRFFSKTVQSYLRSFGIKSFSSRKKEIQGYKTIPMTFPVQEINKLLKGKNYPIIIELHFIRKSKHKFDFHNACQILFDLFTAFDIIEDDDMDHLIPFPLMVNNKWYSYDKNNPGVIIKIR